MQESSSLDVRLTARRSDKPDIFDFQVDWTRPLPDCLGNASASVAIKRPVELKPDKSVEVTGDAGLVVRLTRMKPR